MQIEKGWIGENEELFNTWYEYKDDILKAFSMFELDKANGLIYEFLWNIMCDKWIENSKANSTSITLNKIMEDFEPIFNIIYK